MQNLALRMAATATATATTKFTRAHVAAQVPSTPTVGPQIIWSEAGLPKIAQHMFSLMLRNLASDGFLFVDPNHSDPSDPRSVGASRTRIRRLSNRSPHSRARNSELLKPQDRR